MRVRSYHHLYSMVADVMLCALLLAPCLTSISADAPERVAVLISFDRRPGAAEQALVRAAGGTVRYAYTLVDGIAAELPEAALAHLSAHPAVRRIEPDLPLHAMDVELDNAWGVARIGAGQVHDDGNTGVGIKLAVIDSGVNYLHPDLNANYRGGYDFVQGDTDPMDVYGHGTHVAGTACAEDNDNGDPDGPYGVVGVAPECDLYALRVLDDAGWGSSSLLIAALEWAVDSLIQVANLSLGWDQDPGELVAEAFTAAENAGMVVVAAACNNGKVSGRGENVCWPAKYPSVIAVAATDINDVRASFSSTGSEVELAAPGAAVFSTWNDATSYANPQPVCRLEDRVTACYKYGSGTSMASPHVAGVAALVIAAGITDANNNGRINDEVRQRMIDTATDLGAAGWDPWYGYGLVNAAAAVGAASPESYVVSGEVADAVTKAPIEGAVVSLTSLGLIATSGPDGSYSIPGVPAGAYNMTVSATVYLPQSQEVAVSQDVVVNWELKPATGNAMSVADISFTRVTRGARVDLKVMVTIVDGVGLPVSGATVSMTLASAAATRSFSGVAGSDGTVTFAATKVAKGTYTATVTNVTCDGYTWVPGMYDLAVYVVQ